MENDENKEFDLELNEDTVENEPDWKAEALKYKSMAKRYKEKAQNPAKQDSEITTETTKTVGVPDEVIDLRLDGYSKEEVEFIIKNGGRRALEDKQSYVAIALNTKREQARAEALASQTPDSSQLTEAERKFTPDQLAKMSAKELEDILPHA
jgi:hypothetical protein